MADQAQKRDAAKLNLNNKLVDFSQRSETSLEARDRPDLTLAVSLAMAEPTAAITCPRRPLSFLHQLFDY